MKYIYTVGNNCPIKIGVIGLATTETITFTSTDLSNYNFDNYYNVEKRWANFLREDKNVDAVILLIIFGQNVSWNQKKKKIKVWEIKNFHKKNANLTKK